MDESPFRAALVGNLNRAEMAPLRPAVLRFLSGWDIREFAELSALDETGQTGGYSPDLILVSQSYRDEYSADEVRQGLGTFPVARWICVYGAWCESEGRHGSRWPMAVRVPLRSLETRLAIEARVVQGQTPALPLTAARDEVFEFDTDRRFPLAPRQDITIGIFSPDRELAFWLTDLCRDAGYRVISKTENIPADFLIVDLDPFSPRTKDRIEKLRSEHPRAKLLGLKGLILPQDQSLLHSEGLWGLLSKLTPCAKILEELRAASHGIGPSE